MQHPTFFRWAAVLAAALPAFLAGTARADEVTDWHGYMLTALVTAGSNPPVCSRDAALVSAAVFDAVNGIERRYAPIHVTADAPRGASKRAAAVQAAYVVLLARYPAQAYDLSAKRLASLAAIAGGGESLERGVEWGQKVAEAILEWRSSDGFTRTLPPYLGGSAVGQWRPTPPAFAPGLLPQFATMTPWAIESPDQFRPEGPPALSSDEYAKDFNEVKAMGSAGSMLRSADQTDSARFWQASTGAFQWNRAALDLLADAGTNLSRNARLLAMMNLAVADAMIVCYDSKYHYEFWRPVTAIPLADSDGNDKTVADKSWTPLLATPPHPEYTSAHTITTSAAAAVLADFFGNDTSFALRTHTNSLWVRRYSSFSAAVDEVADARVFAGIHYRAACKVGAEVGVEVATYVLEHMMGRIHGGGE